MASGIASNANESDRHSEALVLREAARLLKEARNFITGFAESAESGFTRQRAAKLWLNQLRESKVLNVTECDIQIWLRVCAFHANGFWLWRISEIQDRRDYLSIRDNFK